MKRKASTIAAAAAVAVSVVLGAPPALAAGETVTAADPTCLGNLEGTAPEVTLTYSSPNNAAVFVPSVNGVEDSGQGVPAGGTGGQTLQLSSFAAGTQVRVVVTIEVVGQDDTTGLDIPVTVPDCAVTSTPTPTPTPTTSPTTPSAAALPTAVPAGEGSSSSSSFPLAGWALLAGAVGSALWFALRGRPHSH